MANNVSEDQIFDACRVLFGPEVSLSRDFLFYLQPSGAKSEYRRRAKMVHPDLYGHDEALQRRQAELFRELVEAQEIVLNFLHLRDKGGWRPASPPRPARPPRPPRPQSAGHKTQPPPDQDQGWYYTGDVPNRYLEIGLFVFYRGRISFADLIASLVWQRRQRPPLGDIARRWGWLDESAVRRIVTSSGHFSRFGERAIEMGLLTSFQVRTLLHFQRSQQQRLGRYFVGRGLVSRDEMESLAEDLARHNACVLARERRWSRTG